MPSPWVLRWYPQQTCTIKDYSVEWNLEISVRHRSYSVYIQIFFHILKASPLLAKGLSRACFSSLLQAQAVQLPDIFDSNSRFVSRTPSMKCSSDNYTRLCSVSKLSSLAKMELYSVSAMQNDRVDPAKRLYSGLLDCARKTSAEGIPGLYKGFTPCLTRAMPVNGAIFAGFTAAQRALS